MRTKMRCRVATVVSWLVSFAIILGMFPTVLTTASATEDEFLKEISSKENVSNKRGVGRTVTETEADELLAGAGVSLIKIALENNLIDINTDEHGMCGGTSHLQGICVDDKLEYMYFSYTTALAKVDMRTGELVSTLTNFGKTSFGAAGGAHLGCLEYYDGYIYASLEYKDPGKKFFLAIVDGSKMTEIGMDVYEMGDDNDVIFGVLLDEPSNDFRNGMLGSGLTGQDSEYNEATDGVNNGHAFLSSGIDGVSVGKWPGGKDDNLYLVAAYGVYASTGNYADRYDGMYNVLQFYSLGRIWQDKDNDWNIPFNGNRGIDHSVGENEMLSADKTLYVFTGNTNWGSQNLEYEWDTGDYVLYTYGNTEGWGLNATYVVDGSVEPKLKTLELGQNNTISNEIMHNAAVDVAKWYGTSYPRNSSHAVDNNGYLMGQVATLKCCCGDESKHTVAAVGNAYWGDSGVKKADQIICSCGSVYSATTGIHWLGADEDGVDYFYVANDSYGAGLYTRTTSANGSMSFRAVTPNIDNAATVLAHYSMDAADLYIGNDGTIYMKNTADSTGKYDAIVEGTTSAIGVNGGDGSALSFDATKYPNRVDRVYLNEDTISYINKEADVKLGYANYSYSFWAKMPEGKESDGNFVPFIGFYRADGTYANVFEKRWRSSMVNVTNGIGTAVPGAGNISSNTYNPSNGNPGDSNSYLGGYGNVYPTNTDWHFYTVTEDYGMVTVYYDGVKMFERNVPTDHLTKKPFTDFEIGGSVEKIWQDMNNRGRFIGEIDDVTIYSGVLTEGEVAAAYAAKPADATNTSATHPSMIIEPVNHTIYAAYDLTIDRGKDLTINGVTSLSGLTEDADYTVFDNSVEIKTTWLTMKGCGKYTFNNGTVCITVTDEKVPVLSYTLAKDSVIDSTVKDSSVYKVDAYTTTSEFTTSNNSTKDGAMVFDGYDYNEPTYAKLNSTDADWLNSVLKDGYTINVWATAIAENGNKMSFLGMYAKDGRPLGVLETYDTNEVTGDNSKIDGQMTIRADVGVSHDVKGTDFSQAAQSSATVNKGEWVMYTVSYDKTSKKLKLYINATLVGTADVAADVLGQIDQFFIGHQYQKYYYNHTDTTRDWTTRGGFYGAMNDLSVYNYALSTDEISILFTGSSITPAQKAQPVLNWTMDANTLKSDGTIIDSSANNYTSYWQNVTPVAGVDGKIGGAVYFNGTNNSGEYSRIWLSNSGVAGLNSDIEKAVTLSFWMKPDSTQTKESLPYTAAWSPVGGIFGESDNRFLIVAEYRDNQLVYSAQSTGDKRIYSSTMQDQWYYVVMTFDSGLHDTALSTTNNYRRIFITGEDGVTYEYAATQNGVNGLTLNGSNHTSRQFNDPNLYDNITHVEFGGEYAKGHWTDTNVRGRYVGAVDDVKIYNVSFQKSDVETLYQMRPATSSAAVTALNKGNTDTNSAATGKAMGTSSLILYYKMDKADLSVTTAANGNITGTLKDYSGNNLDLKIGGLAKTAVNKNNTADASIFFDGYRDYDVSRAWLDDEDIATLKSALKNGNVSYSFWLASDRISSNYMPVMGLYDEANRPLAVANFTTTGGERTGVGAVTNPTLTAVSAGVTDYTEGDYQSSTTVAMNGFSDWHHYVMTYKNDGAVVIYMDGTNIYEGRANANQLSSIDAFELGGMVNPNYYDYKNVGTMKGGAVRGRLYGNLDEVKVYNIVLTSEAVSELYASGVETLSHLY